MTILVNVNRTQALTNDRLDSLELEGVAVIIQVPDPRPALGEHAAESAGPRSEIDEQEPTWETRSGNSQTWSRGRSIEDRPGSTQVGRYFR
jgi:hypothetical protein